MKTQTLKKLNKGDFKYSLILVVVSLLLRLPLVSRQFSLGTDDGIYAISARHVAKGMAPFREVFSSQGTLFLQTISLPVYLLKESYYSPRIMPLLTGLAISYLTFKIAKRYMSDKWAFICGLIAACSGSIIRTTSAITSDGMVVLFSLLTIYFAFAFMEKQSVRSAIWLGLILGFGCSIKSVFMIPTIIFLLAITYRTTIKLRFIALLSSIIIFVIPFLLSGVSEVWNQSVLYHLQKEDKRNIGTNLAKIFSTFYKFDIALTILVVIAFVCGVICFIKKKTINTEIKLLGLAYLLPTFLLLTSQTPLFRNHVVILTPILIILSTYFITQCVLKINSLQYIIAICAILICTAVSLNILFKDNAFNKETGYDKAREEIETTIKRNSLIITNDPGFAFDSHMEIPAMLEDTSKYRFLSKNEKIFLNDELFHKLISNKKVCAVVINDKTDERVFNVDPEDVYGWGKSKHGRYTIWINGNVDCFVDNYFLQEPTP